jgi:hypothetical protein
MRIRGGGGPNRTNQATGAGKTGGVGKAQKAGFAQMVGAAGTASEQESAMKSALMAEMAELASQLESGKATKEEASRRFVAMIIKRKFGKQKGKGAERMEETVADMVEADPQFVSKLQSQLKRIAKDG